MREESKPNPAYVNAPRVERFIVLNDIGMRPWVPGVDWENMEAGYYCGTIIGDKVTELEMVSG